MRLDPRLTLFPGVLVQAASQYRPPAAAGRPRDGSSGRWIRHRSRFDKVGLRPGRRGSIVTPGRGGSTRAKFPSDSQGADPRSREARGRCSMGLSNVRVAAFPTRRPGDLLGIARSARSMSSRRRRSLTARPGCACPAPQPGAGVPRVGGRGLPSTGGFLGGPSSLSRRASSRRAHLSLSAARSFRRAGWDRGQAGAGPDEGDGAQNDEFLHGFLV
jgi:hypothetical protein